MTQTEADVIRWTDEPKVMSAEKQRPCITLLVQVICHARCVCQANLRRLYHRTSFMSFVFADASIHTNETYDRMYMPQV